jgi:ubiquinone/menaquinone biosynthesis C-methylase UbiE
MPGEVEFDQIAPIYDETRRPPTEEELTALVDALVGCRTILEAGVGTGRFAVPLGARNLRVVGVDLSVEMMRRARAKGVGSLVRADVLHLPLRDRSVDAAYMVHVLQILPDPRPVLAELGRVARRTVVVLLPEWAAGGPGGPGRERRERYRAIAAELGYPLPERPPRYRHTLEELSAIVPPRSVQVLESMPPGLTPEARRARWAERSAARARVPPEVHAEIVRRLQAEHPVDPAVWDRPRTERFVAWDPAALHALAGSGAPAPHPIRRGRAVAAGGPGTTGARSGGTRAGVARAPSAPAPSRRSIRRG